MEDASGGGGGRVHLGVFCTLDHYPEADGAVGTVYGRALNEAVLAEDVGLESFWVTEHHFSPYGVCPDPAVLLATMAARTRRLRLGTATAILPLDHPLRTAERYALLDQLSGGRLEFGIGAAWAANEHEMYAIPGLDHRVGLFSEGLQVMRSLWTQERTDFSGRYYTMSNAVANPKPVQKPYPPIWIGSGGPAMLRLTARHADVWNASGAAGQDVATAAAASRQLDEACEAIGRNPAEIRRSVQVAAGAGPTELLERIGGFADAGFTEVIVMMSGGSMQTASDPASTAAMVAERVLPELQGYRPA